MQHLLETPLDLANFITDNAKEELGSNIKNYRYDIQSFAPLHMMKV